MQLGRMALNLWVPIRARVVLPGAPSRIGYEDTPRDLPKGRKRIWYCQNKLFPSRDISPRPQPVPTKESFQGPLTPSWRLGIWDNQQREFSNLS